MNKEILWGAFTQDNIFAYKCPHCYNGVLQLSGKFNSQETEASQVQHGEDWWTHEDVALIFSCTLKCSTCSELVFMVGNGVVDIDHDIDEAGEWVSRWTSFYSPTFFHPPLRLIEYVANTPQEVIAPLSVASSLYFSSPSSCCNSVRVAAELILTKLEVPDKKDDKPIYFSNRINLLPEEQKSTKELFNAIRWIGNHGSHPGNEIEYEDALHALQIMEFLLEEIYGDKRKQLKELAAAINDRKGPVSRLQKMGLG
jgi:hypothetical protein